MKRLFTMLFIALTAVSTISAQRKQQTTTPSNVIKSFEFICDLYGDKNSQVYSIKKNPNTGILESKEVITSFTCRKSESSITMMADDFHKDEPVSYQLMHLTPNTPDNFSINVVTGSGSTKNVRIRTKAKQEMWYMAAKNPDNPQLRDVYAIVWEDMDAENVAGKIYMISSLRPDLFEKDMEKDTSKTFTLDGRMGDDISDSLYVFYMADTYEELNELTLMTDSYAELKEYMQTHDNVLPMPVSRNRRFNISVDIDKRMGGRIRTVMPDGSLCKLWTNIDMVPGETYHITTHNGFYNGDYDYELRVGLHSGKSMFVGKENDDVELTGGYNDDDVVAKTVEDNEEWHQAAVVSNPLDKLTPAQKTEFEQKGNAVSSTKERIDNLYEAWGVQINAMVQNGNNNWKVVDPIFEQIMKQNTLYDKQANDFFQTALKFGISQNTIIDAKKGFLQEYTKQNQIFNECYKHFGYLSPKAQKCQKHLNKLMENWMKNFSK